MHFLDNIQIGTINAFYMCVLEMDENFRRIQKSVDFDSAIARALQCFCVSWAIFFSLLIFIISKCSSYCLLDKIVYLSAVVCHALDYKFSVLKYSTNTSKIFTQERINFFFFNIYVYTYIPSMDWCLMFDLMIVLFSYLKWCSN